MICGRVLLAVTVDASVSLFDADEAPWDVEVHEIVALCVQVHALGGDVSRDEHVDRRGGLLERLDDVLLLDVGEATVQHLHLLVLQLQCRPQDASAASAGSRRVRRR